MSYMLEWINFMPEVLKAQAGEIQNSDEGKAVKLNYFPWFA